MTPVLVTPETARLRILDENLKLHQTIEGIDPAMTADESLQVINSYIGLSTISGSGMVHIDYTITLDESAEE